jgi:ABC-2 type transport system permease protein
VNKTAWLVRREFWENRAIWMVPAIIGVTLTLATLFGRVDLDGAALSEEHRAVVGGVVLFGFGVSFFVVMNIYATWYLLDCLYADRKDRSVLFWKSLPVSDTATVLAKLFTGLVAIPFVYFIAADLSTLMIAFIISMRVRSTFALALWQPDVWLQLQALWLYLIFSTAIWYLPFAGWFMVVSAWAKRAATLWSILPPLAVYLLERWFFGTHRFGDVLRDRALGYFPHAFSDHVTWVTTTFDHDSISTPENVWHMLDPVGFLSSAATWLGVVTGVLFIAATIQLRIRRSEV